jgi:hypothetical protein
LEPPTSQTDHAEPTWLGRTMNFVSCVGMGEPIRPARPDS